MSSVKLRQELERRIVTAAVHQLLAAGFFIDVNNGEEDVVVGGRDESAIMAAFFSTDDDTLSAYRPQDLGGTGWVHFIYGNDGYDVIHDHTVNLSPYLTDADRIAEAYC